MNSNQKSNKLFIMFTADLMKWKHESWDMPSRSSHRKEHQPLRNNQTAELIYNTSHFIFTFHSTLSNDYNYGLKQVSEFMLNV